MFNRIFIESAAIPNPRSQAILSHFKNIPVKEIRKIEDVWGQVKRPYLQKRQDLNLFIGEKKGAVVKLAPDAYGLTGEPHYFFIHAYNCIYECEYCYLQGYFNTPDMVFFINHEDIGKEITRLTEQNSSRVWFHAGEYSDSLALSHITGELSFYFDLFSRLPRTQLELRTKSANIKELLKNPPLPNIITTFSLAPANIITAIEHKTAPLKARLSAIKKLHLEGHPIAVHLDPIVYGENFETEQALLIKEIGEYIPLEKVAYFSLGVPRFSKKVYRQARDNYPSSSLWQHSMIPAGKREGKKDEKIRYNRPLRTHLFATTKELLKNAGVDDAKIYLCMES